MAAPNTPLLILGTGLLCPEIAEFASDIAGIEVVGFVENQQKEKCREKLDGLPILWVDELADLATTHRAVCGLTTTFRSRFTEQVAALGVQFATLVHPTARISSKSTVGEGSIVSPGVHVASFTRLGKHVILNRGALIGHDTVLHDFTTVQPGANIAGKCEIGPASFIGMGAIVKDRIRVGQQSIVGAGAVVVKDVPANVQVVGLPAKVVKKNITGF